MKYSRLALFALAAAALLAGCGKSSDPTNVMSDPGVTQTMDNTPPPVPTGVNVSVDPSGKSTLSWDASTASDCVGFDIFVYDPDPTRDESYVLMTSTDNSTTAYALDPAEFSTAKYYRVSAKDRSDNHSPLSRAVLAVVRPVTPVGGDPENPGLPTMTP